MQSSERTAEEEVGDDAHGPDVDGFAVPGAFEYFGGHVLLRERGVLVNRKLGMEAL